MFKVGVVGIGFIGVAHIEALRRLGNVEVIAITDTLDAEAKAKRLYVPRGYIDYKEMIDHEALDCIHICTPNNSHYEIAMYAMKKGIHVVCEKPLCCTAEEAKEMCEYAKANNIVTSVNFFSRYYPMAYEMKKMVEKGEIGEIFSIHGGYLQDWLFYDTDYNWRLEPEYSGESRAFADIGSHWIDTVEFIAGQKVIEVFADFTTFHKKRKKAKGYIETYVGKTTTIKEYDEIDIGTEDFASVLFHFENGAIGSCNISQVYAGRKNQMIVSVAGSKCSLHFDTEDSNKLWIGRRDGANMELVKDPSIVHDETRAIIGYPGGHVEGLLDVFKYQFFNTYQAIEKKDTSKSELATFEDGLREMVLCEKIIESAKKGCWVKID